MKFKVGEVGKVRILPVLEGQEIKGYKELREYLKENDLFTGKSGQMYSDVVFRGENVIFVGLGKEDKLNLDSIRKAFFKVGNELKSKKVEEATVEVIKYKNLCLKATVKAMAEGVMHSTYKYDRHRTMDRAEFEFKLNKIGFIVPEGKEEKVSSALEEIQNLMDGVFLARNLVNEPSEYIYPQTLGEEAKKALEPLGVEVEVLGQKEIEKLNMTAFLAVARGSSREPKLIVMRYKGADKNDPVIGLVGKGLTYDSGGYAIKPATGMVSMHTDMGGSASVIGAMVAIAKNKLKRNVTAVVAACENMVSGNSYKNGDIIYTMSGKTIEVINTDAEGRITLADAIYYAATKENASEIIDVATLTGAVIVALGSHYVGAVTNDQEMMDNFLNATKASGDKIWQLPSDDDYKEMVPSKRADLLNQIPGGAGSITAGLFLEHFTDNKKWIHLDIAGTATSDGKGYYVKGATGVPVRTLYYYCKNKGEEASCKSSK